MYTFIFRKIYSFFLSKKNHDPVFNASGLVFIMQLIHFFLLVKFFGFKAYAFSSDSTINKLWFYPIGIVWLFLVFKFFNSKKDKLKGTNQPPRKKIERRVLINIILLYSARKKSAKAIEEYSTL